MSKVYESLRDYRRNTAAYWLANARKAFRLSRELDGPCHYTWQRIALREMRLYAKWKARAERAEW